MEMFLCFAGIFALVLAVIIAIWVRRRLIAYTMQITDCLDKMISGKNEIVFDEQDDTLMAKIQVKLRQLYEILIAQTAESKREKEELEEIVSDISHQINTPIANVRMYNHIMRQREIEPEKRQEFLGSIDGQVEKLDSLMQSMIKISRLEVGIIEVVPKEQFVRPLIEQAVCDVALKSEAKGIHITMDCDSGIQMYCDFKWTLEAVFNILDNGVKYTPEGGSIDICISQTDFFVKISIADTGKGIAEERYPHIFKRFYREPEVHEIEGVGIGLFLSRKIIEKQKGFIEVKSQVGRGSVFSIHLPIE